jgi:dTMP kinase
VKGLFIVIEGTDGSGKATQANILMKRLKFDGYSIETADFPQYGKRCAVFVEDYLNGFFGTAKEVGPYRASIFFACDRYAASPQLKTWLAEGKIIVCNRYVSSNMGHQAGKISDPVERVKYLEWLDDLEFNIFNIPRPDITIFLYVPSEVGIDLIDQKDLRGYIKNGKKADMHESDRAHLKDAEQAYLEIAEKFGWIRIDCVKNGKLLSKERIHELIMGELKEHLKN